MEAIETKYKGYRFRSRLEARWAVFFDMVGIRYEYEIEGIVLSDGSYYLPDFYLIDLNCFFEVKRAGLEGTEEGWEAIMKISDGMRCGCWAGIICFGDPVDNNLLLYCQEGCPEGIKKFAGKVTFALHPYTNSPCFFLDADTLKGNFFTSTCWDAKWIPSLAFWYGCEQVVDSRVKRAREAARQVRFEHGECPDAGRRL